MNKIIKIDHDDVLTVKVTGVYEDLPENSSFGDLTFISPWQLLVKDQHYDTRFHNPWGASWFQTLVQIADNADMNNVSDKIKDIKMKDLVRTNNSDARFKPVIFLHSMNKWHLYGDFYKWCKYRRRYTICVVVWYYWCVCAAAGVHQFHEPEHSPFGKTCQRSGNTQISRLAPQSAYCPVLL